VRAALVVLVLAGLAAGTTALAQGGADPIVPVVRDGDVLHLSDGRGCGGAYGPTVRITPPAGVELGWVSVRINRREVVRLTGVESAASVTPRLPRDRTRLSAVAETLDGQRLARVRYYPACHRPPSPSGPAPPPIVGGGGEA